MFPDYRKYAEDGNNLLNDDIDDTSQTHVGKVKAIYSLHVPVPCPAILIHASVQQVCIIQHSTWKSLPLKAWINRKYLCLPLHIKQFSTHSFSWVQFIHVCSSYFTAQLKHTHFTTLYSFVAKKRQKRLTTVPYYNSCYWCSRPNVNHCSSVGCSALIQ